MSLQQRVLWVFFLQPIALGAWIPRIPEIQSKLSLDPAGLALALAGGPIGTLVTLTFAGRLVHALGARRAILTFYPVFFLAMLLPLVAPSLPLLTIALILMSASISVLELGMNIAADDVEKREKRVLMSKAHGFWSLGLMTGTALGAAAAALHLAPIFAGVLISVVMLPLALWIASGLPRVDGPVDEFSRQDHAAPPDSSRHLPLCLRHHTDRRRGRRLVRHLHARRLRQCARIGWKSPSSPFL